MILHHRRRRAYCFYISFHRLRRILSCTWFLSDTCGWRVCKKGITLRRNRSSSRDEGEGRSCNPKRPACQWRCGVQTPLTLVVSMHLIFGFRDWKRDSALWRKSPKSVSWGWLNGKTGILFCSLCLFVSSYICWLKLLNNTIVVIKRSECVWLLLGNQWAWPLENCKISTCRIL